MLPGIGRMFLRRLLKLDHPVTPRSEQEIAAEIERNYRWNFAVNLLDGVSFGLGIHFASSSTILPLFISKLTLNPLLIGLVAVIAHSGWMLPQLLAAGPTERIAHKKAVVVNLGFFLERLPLWLWPLAAFIAPTYTIPGLLLFFIAYAWHTVGAGMVGPAWQDLLARCFPVKRRGRFFGMTNFIGTAVGAGGALCSSWLLKTFAFPQNFVYAFVVAALFVTVSWGFLALTRESVQPIEVHAHKDNQFWSKLRNIIQQDHNFRRFLQARFLMSLGLMGVGFVTVSAVQRWQIADSVVGLYTLALLIGQAAGNLLAGLLADRFGHKLPLEISVAAMGLAFAAARLATVPAWYYGVFALIGMASGAALISSVMISMEFSHPTIRPTYIGFANTVTGIGGVIAPLVGSWIAARGSYSALFICAVGVNLLSLFLFRRSVREPRHLPVYQIVVQERAVD